MKRIILTILMMFAFHVWGQNNIVEKYKSDKDYLIKSYFLNKINDHFIINPNNRNKKRKIILEYLIISVKTNDTIYNEFGEKEILRTNKIIYSKDDLNKIDNYKFINAHFIDEKTNKPYQVTYSFNHVKSIKNIDFNLCYKIKNESGKKRKLNYLHITTY